MTPPYRWPCYYGLDTGTRSQLIAASLEVGEICEDVNADSLAYLALANQEENRRIDVERLRAAEIPGPAPGGADPPHHLWRRRKRPHSRIGN